MFKCKNCEVTYLNDETPSFGHCYHCKIVATASPFTLCTRCGLHILAREKVATSCPGNNHNKEDSFKTPDSFIQAVRPEDTPIKPTEEPYAEIISELINIYGAINMFREKLSDLEVKYKNIVRLVSFGCFVLLAVGFLGLYQIFEWIK